MYPLPFQQKRSRSTGVYLSLGGYIRRFSRADFLDNICGCAWFASQLSRRQVRSHSQNVEAETTDIATGWSLLVDTSVTRHFSYHMHSPPENYGRVSS